MAGGPSHAPPTSDEDSELAHQTGQLSQTGGSASSSGTARRPSPDGRSSMRPTTTYDPKNVDEMIARKDALAMNATGSTSGLRTAQRLADGADQVQDHASKASSLEGGAWEGPPAMSLTLLAVKWTGLNAKSFGPLPLSRLVEARWPFCGFPYSQKTPVPPVRRVSRWQDRGTIRVGWAVDSQAGVLAPQ